MNFLQLVQRAKRESARSGGTIASVALTSGDDQRIVGWVNDAWVDLQRRSHGWDWMRKELTGSLVAGTRGYTALSLNALATDFGRWLPASIEHYAPQVAMASGQRINLKFRDWDAFRSAFELQDHAAGDPQYWSVAPDRKLYVGPTPSAACTLRLGYYKQPYELVLDADTPDMPSEFHTLLVWRALMELASFDSAVEVYARASVNYENADTDLRQQCAPRLYFRAVSL